MQTFIYSRSTRISQTHSYRSPKYGWLFLIKIKIQSSSYNVKEKSHAKMSWFVMFRPSIKFHRNLFCSFCKILLTSKQIDKHTSRQGWERRVTWACRNSRSFNSNLNHNNLNTGLKRESWIKRTTPDTLCIIINHRVTTESPSTAFQSQHHRR